MGRPATNKKQDLIHTAIELMWKNSYGSVSVDDICKTAGVNKGSFYYYFKSKAELTASALAAHYEEQKVQYNAIFSPTLSPRKRLERLADEEVAQQRRTFEKYGHVCGCPFVALGSEVACLEDDIRAKVNEICLSYECYFVSTFNDLISEGVLERGTDTKALAQQMHGFIFGQLSLARIQNSLNLLEKNLKEGMLRIAGIV
jgi:TetR/AcrR family transcriptional repressor of nem operon